MAALAARRPPADGKVLPPPPAFDPGLFDLRRAVPIYRRSGNFGLTLLNHRLAGDCRCVAP